MNRIKKFLRLRRQNDIVKIMTGYGIFICACAIFLTANVILYEKQTAQRMELTLAGGEQTVTDARLQKVQAIDGVAAVSRTLSENVFVKYQSGSANLEVWLLSEGYIRDVYGILQSSSSKIYYANPAAYEQICQSLSENGLPIQSDEITVAYQSETEQNDSGKKHGSRTARIVRADFGGKQPLICTAADSLILNKSSDLRILVNRRDHSRQVLAYAENFSFSNEYQTEFAEAQAKLDRLFLNACYTAVCMMIGVISVCFLWKYGYRSR